MIHHLSNTRHFPIVVSFFFVHFSFLFQLYMKELSYLYPGHIGSALDGILIYCRVDGLTSYMSGRIYSNLSALQMRT